MNAEQLREWWELADEGGFAEGNNVILALIAEVERLERKAAEYAAGLREWKQESADQRQRADAVTAERDALAAELAEQGAEIDRLRRAIEDERGCVPGEFDPFTFHTGPLFEGTY